MIEELEAKNKLLQHQVKDAEERTLLAIHGKFKEFKPFLDQTVKRDTAVAFARLRDREKEIQSLKAETMELRTMNDALVELCHDMLDNCEEYISARLKRRERLASVSRAYSSSFRRPRCCAQSAFATSKE